MSVDRDEVIWAFRLFLRREPESEEVIRYHQEAFHDRNDMIDGMQRSVEYRAQNNLSRQWLVTPVFGEQRYLWVNMYDSFVSRGCLADDWEPAETSAIRALLKRGDVFLDIGANIGWFTLLASTLIGPSGRIHAFEPREDTCRYLRKSVALNDLSDMVIVHNAGVWSAPGEMTLWNRDDRNPGGTQILAEAGADLAGAVRVPIITVDSLGLTRCDLIKIDIEGAEPHALIGAKATIGRCRPNIVSEINPNQLKHVSSYSSDGYVGLLHSLGYGCYYLDGEARGREARIGDARLDGPLTAILFAPRERATPTW